MWKKGRKIKLRKMAIVMNVHCPVGGGKRVRETGKVIDTDLENNDLWVISSNP